MSGMGAILPRAQIEAVGTEEPRRPGRCRMPEAERCRILRDAAAEVFLRDGYAAANMDEVARRAGMSKRTLYQLYPSKTALFEATIGAALAPLHLDTELEREPDLEQALAGILEAAGRHLLALRQNAIFRLVIAEGQRSPELAEALHRVILGHGTSPLQRRIATEMVRGRLRFEDAEAGARALYGMALAPVQMMMLLGLREPPEEGEIRRLTQRAVAIFLHGALHKEGRADHADHAD
jgi:AcrR family transcriptional regulator